MPFMLSARLRLDAPPLHIVIVGERDDEETRSLLRVVHDTFLPNKTLILLDETGRKYFQAPFLKEMRKIDGKVTAYVCRDFACRQPTSEPEVLRAQLAV
jgi:uncharacterized protein YyaL (SSP411 family)